MTIKIQNLTCLIYGWFFGILNMIPNMMKVITNLSDEWMMASFYVGCLVLVVPFIIERYKAICLLNHSSSFQSLYKREFIFAILMISIRLIPSMFIISVFIGGYHVYWVYRNYSTFSRKSLKN